MLDNQSMASGEMAPQHDGTIDGAMANMPDFDDNLISFEQARDGAMPQQRREPSPARDPSGRFAEGDPRGQPNALRSNMPPPGPKTAEAEALAAKAAEEAEASTPEDEYFELPPETEGGEPRRVKADEVWQGYQERETLRAELAEVRRVTPPPVEYDRQIYETVQVRGQLMKELQAYSSLLQPQQPNIDLLNQASAQFNPDLYYQQVQMAQQMQYQLQSVHARMNELQSDQAREQEALSHARYSRERSKLQEIWPEVLGSPQKASTVRDAAARHYGIDQQTFATTIDARFYAVLKDALAYRDGIKAQQTAVKVVRSRPKLVRASARSGDTARQIATNTAMQRVARTGSLEDAADAIGGLI